MTTPARVRPAIVLVVAPEHVPVVDSEFGRYARDYDILCADDADGGRELVQQALEDGQPVALLGVGGGGDSSLQWLQLEGPDGSHRVDAGGLFLLLGADHCGEWLPDEVVRDERGFVYTGREVPMERWSDGRPPAALETTVPGIFAAGDLRAGSMKRVASASGEGAATVALVHAYLAP